MDFNSVLIIDDQALLRYGLIKVLTDQLGINSIYEAENGTEAFKLVHQHRPGIVITEIYLPDCNGLEVASAVSRELPNIRFAVLTASEKSEDLVRALKLGVFAYTLKSAALPEVVDSLRRVIGGESAVSSKMMKYLIAELRHVNQRISNLSVREESILQLIGQGQTYSEIGEQLFISQSTVRTHVYHILEKLNLRNRNEIAAYVARNNLDRRVGV